MPPVEIARSTTDQEASPLQSITCSICLKDDIQLADKAVVWPCMHADFCACCLKQWLCRKRNCPLCKVEVRALICDISPDGRNFRKITLSTAVRPDADNDASTSGDDHMEAWGNYGGMSVRAAPVGSRGHRHDYREAAGLRGQRRLMDTQRNPRPYYHRVMAHSRGVSHAHGVPADSSSEELQLQWRRFIYRRKLYALPLGGSRPARQSQLRTWIRREVEAVLQTQDSLLCTLVAQLAAETGVDTAAACTAVDTSHGEAVASLQRYLGAQAAHFWHELRAFASTPYTVETYDRMARYQGRAGTSQECDRRVTNYNNWLLTASSRSRGSREGWEASEQPDPGVGQGGHADSSQEQEAGFLDSTAQQSLLQIERQARQSGQGAGRPQPSARRPPHRCIVCSNSGEARPGLCLDCAERDAQAQEEELQALPLRLQSAQASPADSHAAVSVSSGSGIVDLEPDDSQRPLQAATRGDPDKAGRSGGALVQSGADGRELCGKRMIDRRETSSGGCQRGSPGRSSKRPRLERMPEGGSESDGQRASSSGQRSRQQPKRRCEDNGPPTAQPHARLSDVEIGRLATERLTALLAKEDSSAQPVGRETLLGLREPSLQTDVAACRTSTSQNPMSNEGASSPRTSAGLNGIETVGIAGRCKPAETVARNALPNSGSEAHQGEQPICLTDSDSDSESEVVCLTPQVPPPGPAPALEPMRVQMFIKPQKLFSIDGWKSRRR